MTYKELKDIIRDLGFEEESTMNEYSSIILGACNRAISTVYHTVLSRIEGYLKFKDIDFDMPKMDVLTASTEDEYELQLPDKVVFLVPLLASYYIWLDDDERKAVMYRNEYDELKDQILTEALTATRCKVVGGFNV